MFQSHAGSIEAYNRSLMNLIKTLRFQSHAGSIEARQRPQGLCVEGTFQSHAGSIEARLDYAHCLYAFSVSIPRWFD